MAIGRGGQRARGRPPHRRRALLEVPVPGDPGRHRRVGDGGQPLPPAQDPLLDAHHRVQPGALRAAGGGSQRAVAARRRLHRRHRPVPARRHPLPQRRHQAPSTSWPSSFCARSRSTSTTSGPKGSCGRSRPRSTRSAGARTPSCTSSASSRTPSRPTGWSTSAAEVLAYWITLDPSGLQPYLSGQHLGRRAPGTALGDGAPQGPRGTGGDAAGTPPGRGRPHASPRRQAPSPSSR